ncbi:pentapeptide repeat-containing protein [Dictyobacter kobayashii]|uniref:Pentapeptide repeat-containing protein n=1 Tax=Dictyobacter kobayashii TaxID=2014872 RepID=A0A402AVF9_9CHLR|nr:pentapeptide repeat-containing protein [Dictyobacter kobayashii]GCE23098.1 hypothetical protein KDK_68980 [Dictyobacter kobayashii]
MTSGIWCNTENASVAYTRADVLALLAEAGSPDRLDLSQCNLEKADLSGLNLMGARFADAQLSETNFQGTKLHGANFQRADLIWAHLDKAVLIGADFSEALACGATFAGANMASTNLQYAIFNETTCTDSNLVGANLNGTDLRDALLVRANLSRTQLWRATITGANLQEAVLHGTELPMSLQEELRYKKLNLSREEVAATAQNKFLFRFRFSNEHQSLPQLTTLFSTLTRLCTIYYLICQERFAELTSSETIQSFDDDIQLAPSLIFTKPTHPDWCLLVNTPEVAEALRQTFWEITHLQQGTEREQKTSQAAMFTFPTILPDAGSTGAYAMSLPSAFPLQTYAPLDYQAIEPVHVRDTQDVPSRKLLERLTAVANRVVYNLDKKGDSLAKALMVQALVPVFLQLQRYSDFIVL